MDGSIIKKINLGAGEKPISVIRHYGLIFCPQILAIFLLLALSFFFLFPLFSWGYWGEALFFFFILLDVVYALKTFIIWYYNAFVVTNRRVVDIDQRGFFERIVSEAPYEKIQDVSYRRKGIWQTIFRYGDVRIQMVDASAGLEMRNVRGPEKVQELISRLAHLETKKQKLAQDENFDEPEVTPPDEEELATIIKSIGDFEENQLERLDNAVRARIRQLKLNKLDPLDEKWHNGERE